MRINQNIMAFNAYRNLTTTNNQMGKSLEKLSSGFRINRAADDAAGLVISEGLRSQIGGLRQATRNAQDGTSVVQIAEGALTEVHAMLQRMRDLAVQAANTGSNDSSATQAAQDEISQLRAEIDRIASSTSFGSQSLLDGSFGAEASETGFQTAANRTSIDALAAGAGEFSISIAGGTAATVDLGGVDLDDTSASTYEADLATRVTNALTTAGYTTAQIEDFNVSVTDGDGDGVWTVEFSSNEAFTTADVDAGSLALLGHTAGANAVSGSGGVFQVGSNVAAAEQITVDIDDIRITSGTTTELTDLSAIDVTIDAGDAQTKIDAAISKVSTIRGTLGAQQNRFEHTISNLQVTTENLQASESRIRDTDMAFELVSFTRHQILQQAGTAMLAQANQVPQSVLSLLR